MEELKTNYVDDVLDSSKNQLRKYQQIQNDDGTVSFVDVTDYTVTGTSFGAKDINDTNSKVNELNESLEKLQNNKTSTTVSLNHDVSYTTESDGYFICTLSQNNTGVIYMYVNEYIIDILNVSSQNSFNNRHCVFVKNGMKIKFKIASGSSSSVSAIFRPFTK